MSDPSKYTAVAHADLEILDPISAQKLDEAVSALELSKASRALDLGCGKGAWVKAIAAKYGCESIGVDRSPSLVAAARDPNVKVGDAKDFLAGTWDAIACIGASHIFGDAESTVAAIVPHLAPGGRLVLGEGYWRREPDPEYISPPSAARATSSTPCPSSSVSAPRTTSCRRTSPSPARTTSIATNGPTPARSSVSRGRTRSIRMVGPSSNAVARGGTGT